ncbi:MAG TPA: hypothetical protein VNO24_14360 [Blastocatellia bacterium]|nr:hypothetical protein [Blastocatellia bacterium]
MGFIRFVLGLVAFVIAIRLVVVILTIASFFLKLLFLAIVIGLFVLVAWVIYKIIAPRSTQQA